MGDRPFRDTMTPEEVQRAYEQARSVRRMSRMERHIPRLCAEITALRSELSERGIVWDFRDSDQSPQGTDPTGPDGDSHASAVPSGNRPESPARVALQEGDARE
jgi:hypothetical protein